MQPSLLIACDFDGTVTRQDTLVEILNRFGDSHWDEIQKRVASGEMSIREGLQMEMGTVRASPEEIRDLLTTRVEVEPSFPGFLAAMRSKGIPVIVLSGGFDLCIEHVLRKPGLWPLPYLANRLIPLNGVRHRNKDKTVSDTELHVGSSWRVEFPYPSSNCAACGHCKGDPLRSWEAQGYRTVFVGNGITDRCAARWAGLTFAKDGLTDWCRQEQIACVPYRTFDDVHAELVRRAWL